MQEIRDLEIWRAGKAVRYVLIAGNFVYNANIIADLSDLRTSKVEV